MTDPIQKLIRSRQTVDAAQLRDPELPLQELANDDGELDPNT